MNYHILIERLFHRIFGEDWWWDPAIGKFRLEGWNEVFSGKKQIYEALVQRAW